MILDGLLMFSSGTTYGAGTLAIADTITATGTSTNTIDLGPGTTANPGLPAPWNSGLTNPSPFPNQQPFRDIGIGDDPAMKLLVQCLSTFATGTSLTITLQGAPDIGTGTPGTFVPWWASPAYAVATLTAGARLLDMDMPRPPAGVREPRYLQLAYTVGGSNFTGPALLLAAIVLDRMDQVYNALANNIMGGYPAGIVVQN